MTAADTMRPQDAARLREREVTLVERARSEFLEMPGLRLVPRQAARLWAIDAMSSTRILEALVQSGFLRKTRDGAYLRLDMA